MDQNDMTGVCKCMLLIGELFILIGIMYIPF